MTTSSSKTYALPAFLVGRMDTSKYVRWLSRKAAAHIKRDRRHRDATATRGAYMGAIHEAVIACNGKDCYTGEELAWEKISEWDDETARRMGREGKKSMWDLPTVDHAGDGLSTPDFRICSWRTNDCKSDLSPEELLKFCRTVLTYHDKVRTERMSGAE